MSDRPWETGDDDQRWDGYLDQRYYDGTVGSYVLRNKVDARSFDELRIAEDLAVEARRPGLDRLGIPTTHDLDGLCQIHHYLFQEVYEWAGELRTVNIGKAGQGFAPADGIEEVMDIVTEAMIRDTDQLRAVSDDVFPQALARIYHGINYAHPFREGNGRTQRHFLSSLAAESGHQLDWTAASAFVNVHASREARNGNMTPMTDMLSAITSKVPSIALEENWRTQAQEYRAAREFDRDSNLGHDDPRDTDRDRER